MLLVSQMKPFKLLQITDPHLGAKPGAQLLGMDTDKSLCEVLESVSKTETPDLIVATGDISSDGSQPSYVRFLKILDKYFPDCPLAWLAGNHDDSEHMVAVAGHPIEHAYSGGGWHFVFLDSHVHRKTGGSLAESELKRMQEELEKNSDKPTIVFLHHQPVLVGSDWIDQYAVDNAHAFFSILDQYPQVKVVCWGHIHQEFLSTHKDIRFLATPSTCVQFEPRSHIFKVSEAMPGYRTFDLFADGSFSSEVKRVNIKSFSIDLASTGY